MTLNEYNKERKGVVVWWVSVGSPTGQYSPLGDPDFDFADRVGLLDLDGSIDEDGSWDWDGEGKPRDDRANSIINLQAFVRPRLWQELTEDC